jgi:hypothetical protein
MQLTMLKFKDLLIKLLVCSLVVSIPIHFLCFRNEEIGQQLTALLTENLLIALGPITAIILAIAIPGVFSLICVAFSLFIAYTLLSDIIIQINQEVPNDKLSWGIPLGWCAIGVVNTFFIIGVGS